MEPAATTRGQNSADARNENIAHVCSLNLPVLGNERVLVRGWRRQDAPALRPACGDPQICRFTTVPSRYTIEAAQNWIARQRAHAREGTAAVWAIVPLPSDSPVGTVGLFGLDQPGATARFGYWLTADWRGKGLVAAATAIVAEWGFEHRKLDEIHIDREPTNIASARVAERLGAVITGSRNVVYEGAEVELIRHTVRPSGRS